MPSPIPETSLMHCAVMFADRENRTGEFLEAVRLRCPGFDDSQSSWSSVSDPRPLAFGPLEWQGWRWQIVLDLAGLIPPVRDVLEQATEDGELQRVVREHPITALVFLTEAPSDTDPLDHARALCRMSWAYLDSGAAAIAFPEGRTIWSSQQLRDLDPTELDAQSAHLFVSPYITAAVDGGDNWLRTWGLSQFGLHDVACRIGTADGTKRNVELEAAEQMIRLVPPYLLELGENIADGDTIEIYDTLWRVSRGPSSELGLDSSQMLSIFTVEAPVAA